MAAGKISVSAQDRRWQAEDDFRSLVSAEQVTGDKTRHRRARTAGRKLVRDETKVLNIKRRLSGRESRRAQRR